RMARESGPFLLGAATGETGRSRRLPAFNGSRAVAALKCAHAAEPFDPEFPMMRSALPVLTTAIALALSGQALGAGGASERALALVGANPGAVHAGSADRFQARDVIVDADGSEHVRMDRTYGGLPVIGGDVVVHSRGGLLTSASLTLRSPLRVALKPALS